MPWFSPRFLKYVALPGTILVLGVVVLYPPQPKEEEPEIPLTGREVTDAKHSEQMRMMAARNQALDMLMYRLVNNEVTLPNATQQFLELNGNTQGFRVATASRFGNNSVEENTCLMMLRRLRTYLQDDPDTLAVVSTRLRAEYAMLYGEMRLDADRQPAI